MSFFIITGVCGCKSNNQATKKEKICKIVVDVKKSKISHPAHEVIDGKFLSKVPKPGSILKETIDKETEAVILNLSNGAKVILKNTPSKDNSSSGIILRALAKGGTMAVTNNDDIPSARFASEMLSVSDIGKFDHLAVHIDGFERCLLGGCRLNGIKEFFENIHSVFTNQTLDSDNVNSLVESYKKDWKEHEDNLLNEINKIMYDNHSYYNVNISDELSRFDFLEPYYWGREDPDSELKMRYFTEPISPDILLFEKSDYPKINQKRALKFLKKCFNPADFTFVFVGDIDFKILKSHIETYIASIPPSKPLINQKVVRHKPSKWEIYTDDKDTCKANMYWVVDQKYSQKLNVVAEILEAYMNFMFNDTSKRYCSVGLNPFYDELNAFVRVSSDAKRIDEDISDVFKSIQNIAESNIDLNVLSKAKNAIQQLYKDADNYYSHDIAIAQSYACSAALHNAPLGEFERFPSVCQAVSSKDLKDLASRLLKGKYYQIILHPKKSNSI